jgi:hypothetical protein
MWYYIKNNESIGPIALDELLSAVANLEEFLNATNNNTLILNDENKNSNWEKAGSFPIIKSTLSEKTKKNSLTNFVSNKKFNHYKYLIILLSLLVGFLELYAILIYYNYI